ncbi:uncharacterized protein V1513DRAFT_435271 [Lipomyces chichibuensis]|uniref:uncharacterized protein n=1 Tax=Lipomyces chichibuensis TaxID=1546026 RepID=UPI0033440693
MEHEIGLSTLNTSKSCFYDLMHYPVNSDPSLVVCDMTSAHVATLSHPKAGNPRIIVSVVSTLTHQ